MFAIRVINESTSSVPSETNATGCPHVDAREGRSELHLIPAYLIPTQIYYVPSDDEFDT